MDESEEIQLQLATAQWIDDRATKLIEQYRNCSTMHGQSKLISQLEEMISRISFQKRELKKYINDENENI